MAKDFSIFRKEGWTLNPDDKVVNGILKGIKRCKGCCPCYHVEEEEEEIPEEDRTCPCKLYREEDVCRCNLYVKENADQKVKDLQAEVTMQMNLINEQATKLTRYEEIVKNLKGTLHRVSPKLVY